MAIINLTDLDNIFDDLGGTGIDRVSFFSRAATSGVTANLATGVVANDGFGNAETMVSVEGLGGGTAYVDRFTGNDTDNYIIGGIGDIIVGAGGNDTFELGGATASLDGGLGIDTIIGFNDRPSGNDALYGGGGDDVLRGGAGVDSFDGSTGNDRVSFFSRAATQGVVANLATGTITNDGFGNAETLISVEGLGGGTAFADTFNGNGLDNTIVAGIGDTVRGQAGDDVFDLEGAAATLDGGDGIDTLESFAANTTVKDTNGDGLADDVVAAAGVMVNLATGAVADGFGNKGTIANVENVGRSLLADTITGNAGVNTHQSFDGADTLLGGGGNDVLDGGAGRDRLDGGGGADLMLGGSGSDTYVVNAAADRVVELSPLDGGNDTVEAFISFTLGLYVENLSLMGTANINGTGNTRGNTINGNAGANTLNGAGGSDSLDGGSGHDTLTGGTGADNFVFSAPISAVHSDTITDFSVADYTIQLENGVFAALGAAGVLDPGAFVVGAGAADAGDRLVYNSTTGALFFDSDGLGGAAQVQIATLQTGHAPDEEE